MAVALTLTGKRPNNTQFGLDSFTEIYKCDATADVVLTDPSVPQLASAHPDYPFMFVTSRPCIESGESASALDLIYTGCLLDDGAGNPTLPTAKTDEQMSVQSVSSSKASNGFIMASPATLQYYSPSSVLTYFSYTAPGATSAPTPDTSPVPITLTISDTTYSPGGGIAEAINTLFSLQLISTIESTEIVAGKFWSNVARTNYMYSPFVFDLPSGPYLFLSIAGIDYSAGDTLGISSGGESATIVVDTVGSTFGVGGGILSYHTTSNTFTTGHDSLAASGGTGSGAAFGVFIVP